MNAPTDLQAEAQRRNTIKLWLRDAKAKDVINRILRAEAAAEAKPAPAPEGKIKVFFDLPDGSVERNVHQVPNVGQHVTLLDDNNQQTWSAKVMGVRHCVTSDYHEIRVQLEQYRSTEG